MAEIVGIIAIITSVSSLCVIFGKTIKKSSCCLGNCETRTPQPSVTIEPSLHHNNKNVSEEFSV